MNAYADKFEIRKHICFGCPVVSIEKDNVKDTHEPWKVRVTLRKHDDEIGLFDFVIVASGLHSDPYIAPIDGQEKFVGTIVHPCMIKTKEELQDKRVVIVGAGKAATDMAVAAATYAKACYFIFRRAHWSFPRVMMGGRLTAKTLLTRVFSAVFSPFPGAPSYRLFRFIHRTLPYLFIKITDLMSADIKKTHGSDLYNDKIFLPRTSMRYAENISMIPRDFVKLKLEGRIIGKLASIERIIDENTIELNTGEQLQADLIISATGYCLRFPFFSQRICQEFGWGSAIISSSDRADVDLRLYRQMVPVGVPNIAFLGFTTSVGQWMLTEVSSHWISDYFLGRLQLPSSEDKMRTEIESIRRFLRNNFSGNSSRFNYYWAAPIDTLLNDMGVVMHRTSNCISEYFDVYRPERFKDLHNERKAKAQGQPIHRWYFGFDYFFALIILLGFTVRLLFSNLY